jgi:hypothetical protein
MFVSWDKEVVDPAYRESAFGSAEIVTGREESNTKTEIRDAPRVWLVLA